MIFIMSVFLYLKPEQLVILLARGPLVMLVSSARPGR